MKEDLKVVAGSPRIANDEAGLQTILAKCDRVGQVKRVVPFARIDHAIRQAEIKLDRCVTLTVGKGGRFGR